MRALIVVLIGLLTLPALAANDRDGDGITDANDRCPDEPEDRDGFQDADGCPDPDNDQDGIADVMDKCPNEPETKNGFQDDDGCPDVVGKSPKANEGTLDVHTTPPAEVTIDGKAVGRTPLSLRVLAGKHQVRLDAGGGRVVIRTITIEAGKKLTLAIEL